MQRNINANGVEKNCADTILESRFYALSKIIVLLGGPAAMGWDTDRRSDNPSSATSIGQSVGVAVGVFCFLGFAFAAADYFLESYAKNGKCPDFCLPFKLMIWGRPAALPDVNQSLLAANP